MNSEAAHVSYQEELLLIHKDITHLCLPTALLTLVTGVVNSQILPGWQAEEVARRARG